MAARVTTSAAADSARAPVHVATARLVAGVCAVAIGLFATFQWIGVPGSRLSLNQNRRRTDSVAALEQARKSATHRTAAHRPTQNSGRAALRGSRRAATSHKTPPHARTAPRLSGERTAPTPIPPNTRPGDAGERASPPPDRTVDSRSTLSASHATVPRPPSPPLPPVDVPQLPEVPQVPEVPHVPSVPPPTTPVPTVPDLPTPKLPQLP